jgi:hypothetical protein
MKMLPLVAAALSLSSLATTSAFAQNSPVVTQDADGRMGMVVPAKMGGDDTYKTGWVFHNLDAREVKRFRTQGFSEADIKGAANIALRAGLDLDYVLSRYRTSGYPLASIATNYGCQPGQPERRHSRHGRLLHGGDVGPLHDH